MLESLKKQGQDLLTLESLPATAAVEISIVSCDPGKTENYHRLRTAMLPLLQTQEGFLAWRAFQSNDRPGVMLHILYWEDSGFCKQAGEKLQQSEVAKEFFALMKETLIFETFRRQPL
ncbi:MAG: antibiotic biosynthesis monooxygenase [Leptospirales bacterium]|nr:antibiotic biosynthesis monooxygenase [Leptospirales bacterium]